MCSIFATGTPSPTIVNVFLLKNARSARDQPGALSNYALPKFSHFTMSRAVSARRNGGHLSKKQIMSFHSFSSLSKQ